MTFDVMLYFMKNLCLHNLDILKTYLKDYSLNQKYIAEKDVFEILRWPFVTFNDLYLSLLNISIHIDLYQNQLINECSMKNFPKFS